MSAPLEWRLVSLPRPTAHCCSSHLPLLQGPLSWSHLVLLLGAGGALWYLLHRRGQASEDAVSDGGSGACPTCSCAPRPSLPPFTPHRPRKTLASRLLHCTAALQSPHSSPALPSSLYQLSLCTSMQEVVREAREVRRLIREQSLLSPHQGDVTTKERREDTEVRCVLGLPAADSGDETSPSPLPRQLVEQRASLWRLTDYLHQEEGEAGEGGSREGEEREGEDSEGEESEGEESWRADSGEFLWDDWEEEGRRACSPISVCSQESGFHGSDILDSSRSSSCPSSSTPSPTPSFPIFSQAGELSPLPLPEL